MSSVKSELNSQWNRICTMEGEISINNCVKRRRSSLLASFNPEQQPHATSLVDQPEATPATTIVKRSSKFYGVSRHHHNNRCEARVGSRVFGNKYFYLGTGSAREEADHAYAIAATKCRGINAVTNFDLNTYIGWPRSGADLVCPQVPKTLNSQPVPSTSDLGVNQNEETEFSFNTNPFKTDIDWGIPRKQEFIERKMQSDPSNRSSPTALSILLRSSMFKELVEKNMNDETEENERKKFKPQSDDGNNKFRGIELLRNCDNVV